MFYDGEPDQTDPLRSSKSVNGSRVGLLYLSRSFFKENCTYWSDATCPAVLLPEDENYLQEYFMNIFLLRHT